jgi:hypothetical protein
MWLVFLQVSDKKKKKKENKKKKTRPRLACAFNGMEK